MSRPVQMSWSEMTGIVVILGTVVGGVWNLKGDIGNLDKRLSVLEQRIDDLHSSKIQGSIR